LFGISAAKGSSKPENKAYKRLADQQPMVFLTLADILESHLNQIDTYGGSHGIRW